MSKAQPERSIHSARIQRAQELSERFAFAKEVLQFYRHVAAFQKNFLAAISARANSRARGNGEARFREQIDASSLIPYLPEFLSIVMARAPQPLAESARQFSLQSREYWKVKLEHYRNQVGEKNKKSNAFDEFIPRAFLQPCIELQAARAGSAAGNQISFECPRCGAMPLLGVVRAEGDGGKKFLVCSFCSQEWAFRRILCPWCGEEGENKLPVYVAEQFPHIRVEACESCRCYLRTVDLTKDGRAIPVVDDLAAIPLSLWADQQGYSRPEPNLLGT